MKSFHYVVVSSFSPYFNYTWERRFCQILEDFFTIFTVNLPIIQSKLWNILLKDDVQILGDFFTVKITMKICKKSVYDYNK